MHSVNSTLPMTEFKQLIVPANGENHPEQSILVFARKQDRFMLLHAKK